MKLLLIQHDSRHPCVIFRLAPARSSLNCARRCVSLSFLNPPRLLLSNPIPREAASSEALDGDGSELMTELILDAEWKVPKEPLDHLRTTMLPELVVHDSFLAGSMRKDRFGFANFLAPRKALPTKHTPQYLLYLQDIL
jgi:hypothetical protein